MKISKLIEKLQELEKEYPGCDIISPNCARGEYTGNLVATISKTGNYIELEGAYDLEDTLEEWYAECEEDMEAD